MTIKKAHLECGVWCCTEMHKCTWQGYMLHRGLSWGTVPAYIDPWRRYHDRYCKGSLVQLVQPYEETISVARKALKEV